MEDNSLHVDIKIPFPSIELAEVAYHALRVDLEPRRSGVQKQLALSDNILIANFTGSAAKNLRVAVNSFFDSVSLVTETIEFAGAPVVNKYSYFK